MRQSSATHPFELSISNHTIRKAYIILDEGPSLVHLGNKMAPLPVRRPSVPSSLLLISMLALEFSGQYLISGASDGSLVIWKSG